MFQQTLRNLLLGGLLCTAPIWAQEAPSALHPKGARFISADTLLLGNGLVTVQVLAASDTSKTPPNEITVAGAFTVGTPTKRLLFGFGQALYSSHLNVRVDGRTYSNIPYHSGAEPLRVTAAPHRAGGAIRCEYAVGDVSIMQRLTPVQFSRTTGAVFIEYEIVNHSPLPHLVGVLLQLDTQVAGNDAASILTRFGYSRRDTVFTAPAIPEFFQAFETTRGPGDTLGLIAQGTLNGNGAVQPNLFIIGNHFDLKTVSWEYTPVAGFYDDSAVLLRWDEQYLQSGEHRVVATYYGVGDVASNVGAPLTLHLAVASSLSATRGVLSPNPFEVNLLVNNRLTQTVSAVQARLLLPPGLLLAFNEQATKLLADPILSPAETSTASWRVVAQCPPADTTLNLTVQVSGLPQVAKAITDSIFIPSCAVPVPDFEVVAAPSLRSLTAGETADFQISLKAFDGFNQEVALSFSPILPGIEGSYVPERIFPGQTSLFRLHTNRSLLAGEYSFNVIGQAGSLRRSAVVRVQVVPAALPDFQIVIQPRNRSLVAGDSTTFQVGVTALAGFNQEVVLSLAPALPGMNGSLAPARVLPGQRAILALRTGRDLLAGDYAIIITGQGAGLTRSDTALVHVVAAPPLDVKPPLFINFNPAPDDSEVPPQTAIALEIVDDITGVDSASIRMQVNGVPVIPAITGAQQRLAVVYQPGSPFRLNETVRVQVAAADRSRPANADSVAYSFRIRPDTAPPFVTERHPGRNSRNVALHTDIRLEVRDLDSGVDSSTIALHLDGTRVQPVISGTPAQYFVHYLPPRAFRDNQTVHVRLETRDLASPANILSPPEEYTFTTVRDSLAPRLIDPFPAPSAINVPANIEIRASLEDDLTGVARETIVLAINQQTVEPILTEIERGFQLHYRPAAGPAPGDTVFVHLRARDRASTPNELSRTYYFVMARDRDQEPPYATRQSPAPGATNVPVTAGISVHIIDNGSGVDRNALQMSINGQAVSPVITGHPGDYLLTHQPPTPWPYNARITVVVQSQDLAVPPNIMPPDTFAFEVVQDISPPFVTDLTPANGATEVSAATNISFLVRDEGAGVDRSSIQLRVNHVNVVPQISGTADAYAVHYQPVQEFLPGERVALEIQAQDLSTPPNRATVSSFFTVGQSLPDLIAVELVPVGEFSAGRPGQARGRVRLEARAPVAGVQIHFLADGRVWQDTTLASVVPGRDIDLPVSFIFQERGSHTLSLVCDPAGVLREASETNNQQHLLIQVAELQVLSGKLVVRPNPFTPNGDGFNDVVEFDFSGLNIVNPTLQIFDANGIPLLTNNRHSGKRMQWNGRDERGRELLPGVYLYSLQEKGRNVASGYVVLAR
ncbi:MAG: gliding motility-associated C-terminal domain-containing protein [candidate division KSB1 bacterium]|nr:gliding motility-associated C-terminal domain-containing protein [candidate division KSB1 bacterium]MDZ7273923.1 gliding motility-associated C-terminal domain-containing protein [candidate division KSB1 bacterium]MDZ7286079.1 gliding motility-associated C-terminal domain-containing protein [candidate division KSB1 bacterium]MDZ7299111.1 gliding motility-associated C-terminal domain-containing protein [candidate division KSB1 bacterium]MDZ7349744.1 gliding motility-associated C-terminal domai